MRACYFGRPEPAVSTPTADAEAHGRRVLRGDGANEVTATFLRADMTKSEKALWKWLRPGFRGYRFDAQVPLGGYVVDFYCPALRLAIEVDGSSHRGREGMDRLRDDWIRANHVDIVRVPATLVLEDTQGALRLINVAMRRRQTRIRPRLVRRAVTPAPIVTCKHGRDSLLCERCRRIEENMIRLRQPPQVIDKRYESRPSTSRGRAGGGMVNKPPAPPGTISRQNY